MKILPIIMIGWVIAGVASAPLPRLAVNGTGFAGGFIFRGINWFGFNNGQTMVDGLWAGGSAIATDFNTIVYRLRLLGFNSVRLPFTFDDLGMKALPKAIGCIGAGAGDVEASVGLSGGGSIDTLVYVEKIVEQLLPEYGIVGVAGEREKKVPFDGPLVPPGPGRVCNSYLPRDTLGRLLYTMEVFARNGFYVVLDYHPMGKEGYAHNVGEVARRWAWLARKIKEAKIYDGLLRGRVVYDIMNEPDSMGKGWGDAAKIYLACMDAIEGVLGKDALYMVEGTGQVKYGLNWGDGFVTDPAIIKRHGITDATVFFEGVLGKVYAGRVIISPHMYGPTVSKNRLVHKGKALWDRMDKSFGYLAVGRGYCSKVRKGVCRRFPVVVGEFGSFFVDQGDLDHLRDFAWYMRNRFGGGGGSWMYWAYNANSGDTGGIVKNNWYDLEEGKLAWLRANMGLAAPSR